MEKEKIIRIGVMLLDGVYLLCIFVWLVEAGGDFFHGIMKDILYPAERAPYRPHIVLPIITFYSAFILAGYLLWKLNKKVFSKKSKELEMR